MQTTKQTYKRQGQWVAWCQPSLFDGPMLFTREAGLEPLQPLNSLLQRRNVTSVLASALDSGRCRGKLAARNAPSSWERCQCLHTSRWLVETAIQTVRWRSKGQLRKMAFCFSGSRIVRKVWNSSCLHPRANPAPAGTSASWLWSVGRAVTLQWLSHLWEKVAHRDPPSPEDASPLPLHPQRPPSHYRGVELG